MFSPVSDFNLLIYNEFLNGTFCMEWAETPAGKFLWPNHYPSSSIFLSGSAGGHSDYWIRVGKPQA